MLSLKKQSMDRFKTIVVDDGSTDGTADMIKQQFPEVYILFGNGNLYWTAATNVGIRHALKQGDADYVMTLNNDTIATENFIEEMFHGAMQKPNSLLGAFAINAVSNKPMYGGARINWKTNTTKNLLDIIPSEKHKGLHKVTHFPGRGLLIPRKVIETIGLFDEKHFPHYLADYDFTLKASRAGFDIYCNYGSKIYTYPEESGDQKNRMNKSLRNYYNHLFGIKGGGNLKTYTIYILRNCPKKYLLYVLLDGYIRRIFGYLIK